MRTVEDALMELEWRKIQVRCENGRGGTSESWNGNGESTMVIPLDSSVSRLNHSAT